MPPLSEQPSEGVMLLVAAPARSGLGMVFLLPADSLTYRAAVGLPTFHSRLSTRNLPGFPSSPPPQILGSLRPLFHLTSGVGAREQAPHQPGWHERNAADEHHQSERDHPHAESNPQM